MRKVLIFAGTTEGRKLGEYCAKKHIAADVSAATEYGASLLPAGIGVLSGKMSSDDIHALLSTDAYDIVIDATHPYAAAITANLRRICEEMQLPYYRLLRAPEPIIGESVETIHEIISVLNQCSSVVLSTLGSNSAAVLTNVQNFRARIWLRILPSETNFEHCLSLGYDPTKIIQAKGPFSAEQNLAHIRKSGAKILLTKESGQVGGYPEKAKAVQRAGIRMITLRRPIESGYSYDDIAAILHARKDGT